MRSSENDFERTKKNEPTNNDEPAINWCRARPFKSFHAFVRSSRSSRFLFVPTSFQASRFWDFSAADQQRELPCLESDPFAPSALRMTIGDVLRWRSARRRETAKALPDSQIAGSPDCRFARHPV
jgi:hypothetical protein